MNWSKNKNDLYLIFNFTIFIVFPYTKKLLVCSAVGIGVGVGVTLVVIFTVGVVLFVLNKKRKRYVLLNSLEFNDKK